MGRWDHASSSSFPAGGSPRWSGRRRKQWWPVSAAMGSSMTGAYRSRQVGWGGARADGKVGMAADRPRAVRISRATSVSVMKQRTRRRPPQEQVKTTRDQVDSLVSATVIEFGTGWCGYCQAARPLIDHVLADHSEVRHLRIEDGRGKRLGRTFAVKLWPTFVFLRDGSEVARVVRPRSADPLRDAMAKVVAVANSEMAAPR